MDTAIEMIQVLLKANARNKYLKRRFKTRVRFIVSTKHYGSS